MRGTLRCETVYMCSDMYMSYTVHSVLRGTYFTVRETDLRCVHKTQVLSCGGGLGAQTQA